MLFLLLPNCSAWPCLGPAKQDLQTFYGISVLYLRRSVPSIHLFWPCYLFWIFICKDFCIYVLSLVIYTLIHLSNVIYEVAPPTTEPENMACMWFGEICSCALNNSRNKFHQTTYRPYFRALYRDRLKCLYVVARSLFLLLLACSAQPCLGPA